MAKLIEGQVYECTDGVIRRLTKIETNLLTYDYYCGQEVGWVSLSPTYRKQVEKVFINGEILSALVLA